MAFVDSSADSSRSRGGRGDVLATLPLVALGAVLLWLALAQGYFDRVVRPAEVGIPSPTAFHQLPTAPAGAMAQPLSESFLYIVVFTPERAAEVGALVTAESNLRTALSEPLRRAELISAADAVAAEAIAEAIRLDFGVFPGLRFSAIVVR